MGATVTRVGRPAKAEAERLSETIKFRLTPPEADALCLEAIRLGITVNAHVRDLVRRARGVSGGQKPSIP